MDFKEVVKKRRSTRRYTGQPVEKEKLQRAMELALRAPSSKNTRSTRLMAVTDLKRVHELGKLRDWGSSLLEEAGAAIVVLGDETASPMWETNAAIMATLLQLALVDEGLATCWVHVGDYLTLKDVPDSQRSEDYVKELLPEIPADYRVLCVISIGYADYTPKPLPEYEGPERMLFVE
ncbi:MAG: nitroreductase family protein [Alistipes sp.]|nr:nitroreductase family protein [Alistipes sp.]